MHNESRKPNRGRQQVEAGQESVWDYPRPPALEAVTERVRIYFHGETIADSTSALRILETSHPPTIYVPSNHIATGFLRESSLTTFCEWKGEAKYFHLVTDKGHVENAGWYYPSPNRAYGKLAEHIAFYPSRVSECYLDDELVQAQAGDFYGGWITQKIAGPFKGEPGTSHW